MGKQVEGLKEAALAFEIALEYDYCPDSKAIGEVQEMFPDATESTLEKYRGLRSDEIANRLVRLIRELAQ